MRTKYIEETFPLWSTYKRKNGTVDIESGCDDVATMLKEGEAEYIVSTHNALQCLCIELTEIIIDITNNENDNCYKAFDKARSIKYGEPFEFIKKGK